jgi:shikimate dehydrogenase
MSRAYAEVIGDPISHSKSPLIHNFWLDELRKQGKLGIEAEYRACHVRPEELADYFARRRGDAAWLGCNVTVPHKEAALATVDGPLPNYLNIGAINVVVPENGGLSWANSDMDGVAGVINEYHNKMVDLGVDIERKFHIAIIGAGGAAKAAVAVASKLPWIGDIRIAVRRPGAGQAMLDQLHILGREIAINDEDIEGLDILINASTMGMGGNFDSSLSLAHFGAVDVKPLVFDMVYHPPKTGLLRAADERGFNYTNGLQMLIIQAAAAFELFFGQPAPREHDAELRALLTA